MNYDREIYKYEVIVEDYISSTGEYRHFETKEFGTEDKAVEFARKTLKSLNVKHRVTVRMIENIVGWWVE